MSVGAVNKNTGDRIPTAGMPAIDNALSATSTNPVQNAIITAALANKQDKTDNALQTTDKTVVGAINEHEGDIDSLKSGLTNVQDDVKLNTQDLTTGSRTQNIAPITLSDIKANNTDGTWANNVYTLNDVTFTVSTDSNGNVDGITVNGMASDTTVLTLYDLPSFFTVGKQYVVSGCYSGGTAETYKHDLLRSDAVLTTEYGSGVTVTANSTYVNTNVRERIVVYNGVSLTNAVFLPMVRLATASATFAPYIPSVESRIDAVESGLVNVLTDISANTHLNKDSNLDTLPIGWYGINLYEGSGTGTGTPSYNTVGILWHVKGASNSFIQYIFGYNYFACRIRSNTTDAWDAWKFGHNALPT